MAGSRTSTYGTSNGLSNSSHTNSASSHSTNSTPMITPVIQSSSGSAIPFTSIDNFLQVMEDKPDSQYAPNLISIVRVRDYTKEENDRARDVLHLLGYDVSQEVPYIANPNNTSQSTSYNSYHMIKPESKNGTAYTDLPNVESTNTTALAKTKPGES